MADIIKVIENVYKNGNVYRIDVQMSVIAPYAVVKYLKYEIVDHQILMQSRDAPFLPDHNIHDEKIKAFLRGKGYALLEDVDLTRPVPGITLELQEQTPSVYNCLFEDVSSYYPYNH